MQVDVWFECTGCNKTPSTHTHITTQLVSNNTRRVFSVVGSSIYRTTTEDMVVRNRGERSSDTTWSAARVSDAANVPWIERATFEGELGVGNAGNRPAQQRLDLNSKIFSFSVLNLCHHC